MESPSIQIPYVCGDLPRCTIAHFSDWGDLHSWSWTGDVPLSTAAARLQSWLFFGIVSVYVGADLRHQKLLNTDKDGHQFLSFIGPDSKLTPLLETTASIYMADQEAESVPARHMRVQQALLLAFDTLDKVREYLTLMHDPVVQDIWNSEAHAVIFGVDVLIDIICQQIRQYQSECREFFQRRIRRKSLAIENPVLRQSIWRSGRCHSLARRLQASSLEWYTILLLPALRRSQTHLGCSKYECSHNSIDSPTGTSLCRPQHAESCSDCDAVHVNEKELKDIIGTTSIPLVEITCDVRRQPRVKLVRGDLTFRYTAISHVWVGGLGNTEGNSLPSCQLLQLWHMIKELSDLRPVDVERIGLRKQDNVRQAFAKWVGSSWNKMWSRDKLYVWLDTLCIPVAEKYPEQNQKAIDSMSQIYAGAESVLVLDPHLRQLQDVEPSSNLFMLHLAISPWMARSWPLQEGAVASNLCVRLRDTTVVLTRSQQKSLLSLSLHLTNSVSQSRVRQNPDFYEVWNALARRTTTKAKDLPAIFAALLNLSAGEILDLRGPDQMRATIVRQDVIPFALMCGSCTQTQSEAGKNTWIPQFPHSSSEARHLDNIHGALKLSGEGLRFEKIRDSPTFGLIVTQIVAFDEELILEDIVFGACYKINSDCKDSNHRKESSMCPSLFIMTYESSSRNHSYRGCCFDVTKSDDDGMDLIFIHSFLWEPVDGKGLGTLIVPGLSLPQLDNPKYNLHISEELAKTRLVPLGKIPFLGISDFQYDNWMSSAFGAALLVSFVGFVPIVRLIIEEDAFMLDSTHDSNVTANLKDLNLTQIALSNVNFTALTLLPVDQVKRALKDLAATNNDLLPLIEALKSFNVESSEAMTYLKVILVPMMGWLVARFLYFEVETVFWKLWLAHLVRQRWAATFSDGAKKKKTKEEVEKKKDLSDRLPVNDFHLWTHIPLYTMACMVLVWAVLAESGTRRLIFFWIVAILTLEPLVGLVISRLVHAKQDLERRNYVDSLPLSWSGMVVLLGPSALCGLSMIVRLSFGELEVTERGVTLAFCAAVYGYVSLALAVLWASGILSYMVWIWRDRRRSS